jgi:hypothetical protein
MAYIILITQCFNNRLQKTKFARYHVRAIRNPIPLTTCYNYITLSLMPNTFNVKSSTISNGRRDSQYILQFDVHCLSPVLFIIFHNYSTLHSILHILRMGCAGYMNLQVAQETKTLTESNFQPFPVL